MRASVTILGATGSIGLQALDVIRHNPDRFFVKGLAAGKSCEQLFSLAREFNCEYLGLVEEPGCIPNDLKNKTWFFGEDSAYKVTEAAKADMSLMAIVGIAGLKATLAATKASKRVLLANKEALVTGGNLVLESAKKYNSELIPVDSEHSAIFQCLRGADGNEPNSLILTASGGALRDWPEDKVPFATVNDVLKHPTWKMGKKITVDCATMVNKGLEIMEACYLFNMPEDKVNVLIHPQSTIHSAVEFKDGQVIAQLGNPDMRAAIAYAMGFPERIDFGHEPLKLWEKGTLTFKQPSYRQYPALKLAREVFKRGDSLPVIFNGANEEAVALFLDQKISFGAITECLISVCDRAKINKITSYEDVMVADKLGRDMAINYFRGKNV